MTFLLGTWLQARNGKAVRKARNRLRAKRKCPTRFVPRLEALEDRALPSVVSGAGAGDGPDPAAQLAVAGGPKESVVPQRPGQPSPIQHVIYVIKENRTYDQVLGSLGKGNGDPSLDLFGDESAPNQRELARRFVTLDNFYADAEVTADGWYWSTAALANTFDQKSWPQAYGGRNRPFDFAGVGTEGANFALSPGKDPADAFIWDKLSDAGISYRNYGFRVANGQVASTEPRLARNTDPNFAGFDVTKPDAVPDLFGASQPTRVGEWLREFNQYVADTNLPTVEFVRLGNDHTFGSLAGRPTPRAYMADNDLALGKLVDAVSHSPYWRSTAVFVLEDDAQDGPDHVDAHRIVAQVISPYTQTGQVDSTLYSTVSMLRTMELILGLPPMTQYDAAATSMSNSFTDDPNFTPYTAITPTQNIHEKNPAPNPLTANPLFAQVTAADFEHEDMVEPQLLNQMIWQSVKGQDSAMPAPHTQFSGGQEDGGDDDGQLHPGPQGDGTGVTPDGWLLTPAGEQVQLGDRPYGLALSPDGQTLLVSNDGKSTQSLMVVDAGTGAVVQALSYKRPEALNLGVAFSPDGRHAYASAGGNNKIRVYDVSGQHLTERAPIHLPLPIGPDGKPVNLFPAGLTLSGDGETLYVADTLGDRMSMVHLATGAVTTIPVGHNPYSVALSPDGRTAYVSNWGDTTVSIVDVSGGTPRVVGALRAGTHPNAMALNPHSSELYVANADSDNVSVFDTATNHLLRTIDLRPFRGAEVGSSPNALALSPDGHTLYVANATDNDIAVVRLGHSAPRGEGRTPDHVEGLIPTAWSPAGVAVSPDGGQLYVINGKGLGAGPNPHGPNPYTDPDQRPFASPDQYVGSMIVGTLSIIDVPDQGQLKRYTRQVFTNDRFDREREDRVEELARPIATGNEEKHRGDDGRTREGASRALSVPAADLSGSPAPPGTGPAFSPAALVGDGQVPGTGGFVPTPAALTLAEVQRLDRLFAAGLEEGTSFLVPRSKRGLWSFGAEDGAEAIL